MELEFKKNHLGFQYVSFKEASEQNLVTVSETEAYGKECVTVSNYAPYSTVWLDRNQARILGEILINFAKNGKIK